MAWRSATLVSVAILGRGYAAEECTMGHDGPCSEQASRVEKREQVLLQLAHTERVAGRSLLREDTAVASNWSMAPCCASCGMKPFCSPNSGQCYRTKAKDYYASCPVSKTCEGSDCPIGYETSSEKSGRGQWCEVPRPPSAWSPLKTCAEGTGKMKVKVLAYNLFWWNLFGQRGGEDGRAGRKIASNSGGEEFDFIGFQECDDINRILGDAKRWGLSGDYGHLSGGRAIAIAYRKSRWTLISSGVEDVGEDSREQWYGKRSAHWGRFRHRDGRTVFFANHHGPLPVSKSGGCAGSATAYNIIRMIAENAHSTDAVFLVGDFNAQPWSSRIQSLDKYMHRVYTGSSHGGVDHIFSSCGGSHVVKSENLGTGGSDHDAITTVFEIPHQVTSDDTEPVEPAEAGEPVELVEPEASAVEASVCFNFGKGAVTSSSCSGHGSADSFLLPQNSDKLGDITWGCNVPGVGVALCDESRSLLILWKGGSSMVEVSLEPLAKPVGAISQDGLVYVACFGGEGKAGLAIVDPVAGKLLSTHEYSLTSGAFVHNVYSFNWNGKAEIMLAVLGNPWGAVGGDGLVLFDRAAKSFVPITTEKIHARSAVQQSDGVFYVLTQEPNSAPTKLVRLEKEGNSLNVAASTELPRRAAAGQWGADGGADVLLGTEPDTVFCTDRLPGDGRLYYYTYKDGAFKLEKEWSTGKHPRHAVIRENGDIVVSNKGDNTLTVFKGLAASPLAQDVKTETSPAAQQASFTLCAPKKMLTDC
eukprot:TRINITY_DN18066_c0_g1_i1.p1 TRINITY_DN18066_c0_g1~~TRINITY_DN18066_c0_g1_i1.p1  ORF type:complete len:756 (+),score=149.41 TRINITY_DN18066_c0_g1_i1:93-2360(+)